MKREDLQKIEGLIKEQIDSIMDLHQNDVTAWNQKFETQKNELANKDQQINDLTEQVKEYDGADVKQLQKDIKDWKTKYDTDMAKEKKNSAIKLAVLGAKPRNEKALMALIDTEAIKLNDDGSLTGLTEQLDNIKKDNDFLFEPAQDPKDPEPKPNQVDLGGNHDTQPEVDDGQLRSVFGLPKDAGGNK